MKSSLPKKTIWGCNLQCQYISLHERLRHSETQQATPPLKNNLRREGKTWHLTASPPHPLNQPMARRAALFCIPNAAQPDVPAFSILPPTPARSSRELLRRCSARAPPPLTYITAHPPLDARQATHQQDQRCSLAPPLSQGGGSIQQLTAPSGETGGPSHLSQQL